MTAHDDLPSIGSYPTFGGLQLHSLAHPYRYHCDTCGRCRESTFVAISGSYLLCPACYGRQLRNRARPVVGG